MIFDWNIAKNATLKERYGFGFERIMTALGDGSLLDTRNHPNQQRYAHQKQFVLNIENYAWVACFVTNGDLIFLKTFFPSRTATKEYLDDQRSKKN